jgi:hypothetical protein
MIDDFSNTGKVVCYALILFLLCSFCTFTWIFMLCILFGLLFYPPYFPVKVEHTFLNNHY